jgi:hypothetical protein
MGVDAVHSLEAAMQQGDKERMGVLAGISEKHTHPLLTGERRGTDTERHPHTNQNSINGDFSRVANAGINPNTVNTYLGLAGNVVVSAFAPATFTPIEAWTVTGGGPDTYAGK